MNKEILRFALPNIVSNISIPLLSAVDTALMGHLSVYHLGAVGLGSMIFNFLYWNFGFLRMGTTGLVAQAHGANDQDRIVSLLGQSLMIGLAISILLWATQGWLREVAVDLLLVSSDVRPLVYEYFDIVIWGAPATICTYTFVGWLFGRQDAVSPMVVTILLNMLNIGLSYYLVVHQGWGIKGTAIGTVVAQYFGFMCYMVIALGRIEIKGLFREIGKDWISFLKINGDLFIRTVALTFAFGFFYRQSSSLGPVVLAANVVLLQFLSWMSYGIDGFAHATESLVGRYYGEGDNRKVMAIIKRAFVWGAAIAVACGLIFGMLGSLIAGMYTDQLPVLSIIEGHQLWLALLPLGAFVCYIWDGVFIGLSASRAMRDSMILCLGVYVGVYTIFGDFSHNIICISFTLFLVMRGVTQTAMFFSFGKRYGLNIEQSID